MRSTDEKAKVLVVDDEPMIRRMVGSILSTNGYRVVDAESAPNAIHLMSGDHGIELLITDIVMPNVTGNELAERLKRDIPDLRVLFMSGYDYASAGAVRENGSGFIRKPFRIPDFLAEVERVMA